VLKEQFLKLEEQFSQDFIVPICIQELFFFKKKDYYFLVLFFTML